MDVFMIIFFVVPFIPVHFQTQVRKVKKMKKVVCLCLLIVFSLSLVGCGGKSLWTKTITITQQQIEDKMVGKFPMHKENRLIKADFSNPTVLLTAGSERITFGLNTEIEFLRDTYSGDLMMSAELEYVPSKGSFYLVNSEIESLTIGGLSKSKCDKVAGALGKIIYFGLDTLPVYTLNTSDIKQKAAKAVLKSVVINDGNIEAVIGI